MQRFSALPADPTPRLRSREFIESYQDRLSALRGIRVPCLVVGLQLDTDTFVIRAREVASAIPDCRYVEIADAGHLLPITEPRLVIEPVLRFFQEVDST